MKRIITENTVNRSRPQIEKLIEAAASIQENIVRISLIFIAFDDSLKVVALLLRLVCL